ncbi:hypothetical protein LX59_02240 [Azomonas agilis]|uniref:Lon N-terminal domain-containing protein n=1 Tax=Azomonas agilis TaxID=116849 RepID=A0A562I0L8_9GAMM|nr:LON peptidase substrate-binding domain-containing protein [Azomonas agilis]TWH64570.1 hypothetical protein LX59_02240 [Azomonas agilis]
MSLPLFPLHQLLFPGCMLDLQLFEPRYLDMLKTCLKTDTGFGVVGILHGQEVGLAASHCTPLGCEALIRDWHLQKNGLLGIRVQAVRRFRVLSSWVQPDQLLQAEVAWLPERPDSALTQAEEDLLGLWQALSRHPQAATLALTPPNTQHQLLDQLAYALPLPMEHKQQLLALESVQERLSLMRHYLSLLQNQ